MLLEAENICKSFGSTVALHDVPITLRPGRIHALVGENGAGKSTLMKALAGAVRRDSGEIRLDGTPFNPASAAEARARGVALVFQELTISPSLSVAENIFIDRLAQFRSTFGLISRRRLNEAAREVLDRLHLDIDPDTEARELDLGQMKSIEICRGLSVSPKIILLDESTAFLNYTEVRSVLETMTRLRAHGIAVAFVSHHLDEVFEVADDLTVLKDGKFVGHYEHGDVSTRQLHDLMVGRELAHDLFPPRRPVMADARPVLTIRNARTRPSSPSYDLDLRCGEILGVSGLKSAGGERLIEALAGDRPMPDAQIKLSDRPVRLRTPHDSWSRRIAYLPGDRGGQGLITRFTITDNVSMSVLPRRGPFFDTAVARQLAQQAIAQLEIKAEGADTIVETLSGGNMQKVLLGKCLASNPVVLLMNNPTRGVDLGARQEIYRTLGALAGEGLGIVIVSEDLPELIGLSHRIAVFRHGRLEILMENDPPVSENALIARMI